jgi:hypothetical protein
MQGTLKTTKVVQIRAQEEPGAKCHIEAHIFKRTVYKGFIYKM